MLQLLNQTIYILESIIFYYIKIYYNYVETKI
jgi:hypothetical protein